MKLRLKLKFKVARALFFVTLATRVSSEHSLYRFVRDAEGALRVLVREPGDAEGVNRHGIIILMLDGNS